MLVAIVIGHTRAEPGAKAVAPLDQYEYDYNLDLAHLIPLQNTLIVTRDLAGVHGAYKTVNAANPDCCIELHFNSGADVSGTETLFGSKNPDSEKLARILQGEICGTLGTRNRGIKFTTPEDRGYTNVNLANCPSVIIEPFFGSHTADAELGLNKKQELANAIANGVKIWASQRS